MSLSSMTGFARVEGACESGSWVWEVRSVNGKGLDIRFRMPGFLSSLEEELRKRLRARLKRGTLQLNLQFERSADYAGAIQVNTKLAKSLLQSLGQLAEETGTQAPQLADLLQVRGVLETSSEDADTEDVAGSLLNDFDQLVSDLVTARDAEGANLEKLLRSGLVRLGDLCETVRSNPATDPANLLGALKAKVEALQQTVDPDRLAQEVALLAVKADVTEELDRLHGHVSAAWELLATAGPKGRKLEFLTQEFHREANTLCSKSQDRELTACGLEMKTVIDQIREQAANVE